MVGEPRQFSFDLGRDQAVEESFGVRNVILAFLDQKSHYGTLKPGEVQSENENGGIKFALQAKVEWQKGSIFQKGFPAVVRGEIPRVSMVDKSGKRAVMGVSRDGKILFIAEDGFSALEKFASEDLIKMEPEGWMIKADNEATLSKKSKDILVEIAKNGTGHGMPLNLL